MDGTISKGEISPRSNASTNAPLSDGDRALRASQGLLRTEETTALEPKVLDSKLYLKGIGEVEERAVNGPREQLRLVEVVE